MVLPEVVAPHHAQPAPSPAYPGYPPHSPAGYEQQATYDAYYQQQQQQQQYAAYFYATAGQQPAPGQPPYGTYGTGYPSR